MSLSREDVEKVALLGRLRLSPQELETMTAQIGRRSSATLNSLRS